MSAGKCDLNIHIFPPRWVNAHDSLHNYI